jgi:hypothetical protein
MVSKAGKKIGPAGSQPSKADVVDTRQVQGAAAGDQKRLRVKSPRARWSGVRQAQALILSMIDALLREMTHGGTLLDAEATGTRIVLW